MMPTKRKKTRSLTSALSEGLITPVTPSSVSVLVAAGLYRTDLNDTILPPSNVSLYGDVSTVGFYLLGVRGNHLFPQDKYRLNYNLYFYSFPSLYWGKGYENGSNDDNESDYDRFQAQVKVDFMTRDSAQLLYRSDGCL